MISVSAFDNRSDWRRIMKYLVFAMALAMGIVMMPIIAEGG